MLKGQSSETDKAVDREVGRRIRERRLISGMTQTEVARAVGVSFQQLQKYERGANRVAASRLAAIADAIGATASELLPAAEPSTGGGVTRRQSSPGGDDAEMLRRFQDCSPRAKRILLELTKCLAVRTDVTMQTDVADVRSEARLQSTRRRGARGR